MARKATTSRSEIEALINKGFTQAEIAVILGISTSGVNWHLKNTGGEPFQTLVGSLKAQLPWEVTGDHVRATPYRRLLDHLEYRTTGGRKMPAEKLRKLRGFYERLNSFKMVVRYDPNIGPRPGQKFGGFEYVPREDTDGDLILREDEHTKIPVDSRDMWRLPSPGDWPE